MTIWNMEITASESPQTVHIPLEGKYYAIKNTGDHDILVSSYVANPTEGADDVMKIPSGSAAIIPVKDGDLYVSAEEDGTYSVSIQDDKVLPWGGGTGSGGGSGGDNTHYKGTTTTPLENGSTTNPIAIVKDDESYTYTAVFGDVVVYGYTEFVFDGTAWSEFGRPFDTVPTSGSMNAVTSDGVYRNTAGIKNYVNNVLKGEIFNASTNVASGGDSHAEGQLTTASGNCSHAEGYYAKASGGNSHAEGQLTTASGNSSHAEGYYAKASGGNSHAEGQLTTASGNSSHAGGDHTIANKSASTAIGRYNVADTDVSHLLIVGNGTENARSNILEVSETDMNVNGDIKVNNVTIPTPYTTMPTITADMLGQIAMYVGATGGGFTQGCFYLAATDGAAEPTYSWVQIGGGGYSEKVLWQWQSSSDTHTDITLSASFLTFDALILVSNAKAFLEGSFAETNGEGYTSTVPVSELVRHSGGTIVIGGADVSGNSHVKYAFDTSSPTTITHASHGSGSWAQTLRTVIGIKY